MKNLNLILAGCLSALVLSGCAVPTEVTPVETPSGFWMGLWHGFISLWAFIGSLFSDNIAVYDAHNKGGLYDFGFILGVSMFFGGSLSASK